MGDCCVLQCSLWTRLEQRSKHVNQSAKVSQTRWHLLTSSHSWWCGKQKRNGSMPILVDSGSSCTEGQRTSKPFPFVWNTWLKTKKMFKKEITICCFTGNLNSGSGHPISRNVTILLESTKVWFAPREMNIMKRAWGKEKDQPVS